MEQKDFNGLSVETSYKLLSALCDAMDELQGKHRVVEAMNNALFCELLPMQVMVGKRIAMQDTFKMQYCHDDMHKLLHELYLRMQTYYHYGACHGRELKGLAWTEEDGKFVLMLDKCDVRLTHSIRDEQADDSPLGTLVSIAFDPDIDCEDKNSEFYEHYEEALGFCCVFKDEDNKETTRDIAVMNAHPYRKMLKDTLAGLDLISEMANEATKKP